MVVVFHLGFWSWAHPASTPASILRGATAYPEISFLSWWGWVGVEAFFVISGLVIAYSASHARALQFFLGRVLRLMPGAFVCATITLGIAFSIDWLPSADLVTRYLNTLLFQSFGPWIDGVYWTLGIEVVFYGMVGLLLAGRRFGWFEAVMAVVGLASCVFWAACLSFRVDPAMPFLGSYGSRLLELALVRHGMYFAVGAFLWFGFFRGWTPRRICILAVCIVGGSIPILHEAGGKVAAHALPHSAGVPVVVWLVSVALIAASIPADRVIKAALSSRGVLFVQVAGLATYPLYLLHDVVGVSLLRGLLRLGMDRYSALVLSIAVITALSVVITVTAERRIRSVVAGVFDYFAHRQVATPIGEHRSLGPMSGTGRSAGRAIRV
jgi:peptidoglycan/LPS O-acetylase OafA/YrhL